MFWRIALCAAAFASSVAPSSADADELSVGQGPQSAPEPEPQPDPVDSQEIGAVLGLAIGGPVSPGGLAVEGRYLYRLSETDWLESGVNFSFGASGPECFRDREGIYQCEHGLVDGFAAEGTLGVRRYFVGQAQFRPFARAGLGLRLLSFSGDEVRGIALPVYFGGGVRAEVADRVLVVGDATLRAGPALLNQNLGIEPNMALSISAGVEFTLE